MSCPYFEPVEPRGHDASAHLAMLPLGDSWTGICLADPQHPAAPEDASLQTLCNIGYARENCRRFPTGAGPDAVRFAITSDDGAHIGVFYTLECDHHPYGHGPLEYRRDIGCFVETPPVAALSRQAQAYVDSYLRRMSQKEVNHGR